MIDPILREFPERIETERLLIRAPQPGDGAAVCQAVNESLPELRPWLPWAQAPLSAEAEEAALRRAHADSLARKHLMLVLLRKQDGFVVGCSGMHNIDWAIPRFEIGYWQRTSLARQGYITEAVKAISAFCFDALGARRVEIHCDERNTRSAAVARRCGFTLEAVLHNDRRDLLTHELTNTLIFAQVRGD